LVVKRSAETVSLLARPVPSDDQGVRSFALTRVRRLLLAGDQACADILGPRRLLVR
jgi:hypothetical protein